MLYVDAIDKADPDPIALFASKIAGAPGPKANIALCLNLWESVSRQPPSQGATARAGYGISLTIMKGGSMYLSGQPEGVRTKVRRSQDMIFT